MRLAAIDYGTVTTRLLVADVTTCGVQELLRRSTITHLGEGLGQTGIISPAARERILAATRDYLAAIAALIADDPADKTVAVATSAMRDATNSAEVLAALRELGLEVELIAGNREAELSFIGTVSGFLEGQLPSQVHSARFSSQLQSAATLPTGSDAAQSQELLVIDIGGGSTEVIVGIAAERPQVLQARSFDIGSRRVTDLFLRGDPPSEAEQQQARDWIRAQVAPYFQTFARQPELMLAVAGTATTAVSVREQMAVYDSARVHGAYVLSEELAQITRYLAELSLSQRQRVVGLEPQRAPVIVGGLLVLQVVLEVSGLAGFTVSESDILQGILLDHYARCHD